MASNPFSAMFWGIAHLFTDDPNQQAAAAQLWIATFGLALPAGATASQRQQIRTIAPAEPSRPVAAQVRPTEPVRPEPTMPEPRPLCRFEQRYQARQLTFVECSRLVIANTV